MAKTSDPAVRVILRCSTWIKLIDIIKDNHGTLTVEELTSMRDQCSDQICHVCGAMVKDGCDHIRPNPKVTK